jgi:peptide/nickel transport system substrate-binding protein
MTPRLLFACVVFCVVGGCANRNAGLHGSDLLIIARLSEPVSLNPLYLQGSDATDVSALGYSFLTNYDANDAIVADAATVVPTMANGGISRDRKRVVYHLRRDIVWQDGYPLTARDVEFTYRAIMNPSNTVPSRGGYDHIKRIWASDPYTVIVKLTQQQGAFVTGFFGGDSNYPILPAHLLAAYRDLNHVPFNQAPVGSGPYRFTRWIRGERLDLTANDRYYGAKPTIRHISIHFVHDHSTIVNELITHEVDATFFASPTKVTALSSIPSHRVIVSLLPYFEAIVFNMNDPVLNDLAVRHALSSAVDRRALVAKATLGLYDANTGMRGMFTWAFDPSAGTIAYDPARARALLSNDGWISGDDGIRVKNGRRLEMQLLFNSQSFVGSGVVPMIIDAARAVGINLVARGYDPGLLFASSGPLNQGEFQVALLGYQNGVDPDPSSLISCGQRAPNGLNWARYCSEYVDHAALQGASVYERAHRRRIYSFIQRRLLEDIPYDFLWQTSEIDVIPSALRGYEPSAVSPYNSVAHWRLER